MSTEPGGTPPKSKGKWRLRLFLILLAIILIWLAMRRFGIKMTYRTEDTEIIDPYQQ